MIGMALVAVLMCVSFASCSSDDESIEYIKTELTIDGIPFMAYSWGCYYKDIKTDVCSTFWYGNYETVNEKGDKITIYDEYFYGGVEGQLTNGTFCDIEFNLEGIEASENRFSLTPFKESNLNLSKYSENFGLGIRTDIGEFSSRNSYESGYIYVNSFTSNTITLSFNSYKLIEAENSITLNGSISFKYHKDKIQE